jgi:hypothetical protein
MSRLAPILGVVLLCLGATLAAMGAWQRGVDRLAAAGTVADGVVVAKESTGPATDPNSQFVVRYRFVAPDGRSLEGRARVDQRRWDTYGEGSSIPVLYLPADPSVNRPRSVRETRLPRILWLSGAGFLLAGVATIGFAAIARRRRRSRRAFVVHRRGARR